MRPPGLFPTCLWRESVTRAQTWDGEVTLRQGPRPTPVAVPAVTHLLSFRALGFDPVIHRCARLLHVAWSPWGHAHCGPTSGMVPSWRAGSHPGPGRSR